MRLHKIKTTTSDSYPMRLIADYSNNLTVKEITLKLEFY